jgi:transcriptional regulator with XRE-family HTH domain
MEFGKWVVEIRKQKGWDIRTFGDKTGLEISTINRVEKLYTQATLYTAFRICEGLNISLYDLIDILGGRKLQILLKDNSTKHEDVVTLKSVEKVVNVFHRDRDKVINEMVARLNELQQELNFRNRNYNGGKGSANEEIVSAPGTFLPYSKGEVERLLFSSPLSYQHQLKYPTPVKVDLITRVYEQNGALMIQDAEAFLKRIKAGRPALVSSSATAAIERIRLTDILQADEEEKQEGKLIGVYWEACRLYAAFSPFGRFVLRTRAASQQLSPLSNSESTNRFVEHEEWELRLATLYLMICRWEQHIGKSGTLLLA